jgi:hypothetical protein
VRVLVCGSRDWRNWRAIDTAVRALPPGTTIVHGGARGADLLAGGAATRFGYPVEVFLPDWQAEPRRAGILRNLRMLDTQPDRVVAFQRNGSRGTQHTIDEARRRGIPVEVITGGD